MYTELSQHGRLEQTLSPRMIQFYEMLQLPLADLDQLIVSELAENPALELVETSAEAPAEAAPEETAETSEPVDPEILPDLDYGGGVVGAWDDEGDDPMALLPAPTTLRDHLRWSFAAVAYTPEELRIGQRIIDEINEDGYFESNIGEVAVVLGANVVEVERVLTLVQCLEPVGVGARDLQECLEIQLQSLADQAHEQVVARRLVSECWADFSNRRLSVCARRLKVSEAAVDAAAEFLRSHCHPYPGRQFRLPWQDDNPTPTARPEVRILENPVELPPDYLAEMLDSSRLALRVDRVYRKLYDELGNGSAGSSDETEHVKGCVKRARQFIISINQRRETVRRIAQEVANEQVDYLALGPAHLKPLTRIEIARRLGVHESTVGRAVSGKHVVLPSCEVVSFETFFDSAQPLRLALEQLLAEEDSAHPLSDQALADRLNAMGHDVARRTVAKYRTLMKVPSASKRRRR